MADGFGRSLRTLFQALNGQLALPELAELAEHPLLWRIASFLREPGATQTLDFAGLIRDALAHDADHAGQAYFVARRSNARGTWPTREQWQKVGLYVTEAHGGRRISHKPWDPEWHQGVKPALLHVYSYQDGSFVAQVRPAADPFFTYWTGHDEYTHEGQKSAVHAAMSIGPGEALVVLLPTGSGKSAVALVPSLVSSTTAGTSIIVVPTVSLALDQERSLLSLKSRARVEDVLPTGLAYFGGLDIREKRKFHERLRNGSQRVMFISPEALLTSCNAPVLDAARAGRINFFVVDEAHLVSQWGAEFRPDYQLMAGFRDHLLKVSPAGMQPRTLLMTATLTQQDYETLATLFGSDGRYLPVTSSLVLRAEPTYLRRRCSSKAEQVDRVIESVHRLPRPLIVYTTKRDDTEELYRRLRAEGYTRAALMHGGTPSATRESIVRAWSEARYDIIVATSAFGVGVDNKHVRSVLHACVPENLDRYYQEVGRGGRDGKASLSLMLFTDQDLEQARRLNDRRMITVKRGLERWKAMYFGARRGQGRLDSLNVFDVSIDAPPTGVDWDGPTTRGWNLRTINLMVQAGMLRHGWITPPECRDESDRECSRRRERYLATRRVQVLDDQHLHPARWQDLVQATREAARHSAAAGSDAIKRIARTDGQDAVQAALLDTYKLEVTDPNGSMHSLRPLPPRSLVRSQNVLTGIRGPSQFGGGRQPEFRGAAITYRDAMSLSSPLITVFEVAIQHGYGVVVELGLLTQEEAHDIYSRNPGRPFVVDRSGHAGALGPAEGTPRLVLFGPAWQGKQLPGWISGAAQTSLTVYPSGALSPLRADLMPDDLFVATVSPGTFLEAML